MPGQCEGTLIHLETDITDQRDCQARGGRAQTNFTITGPVGYSDTLGTSEKCHFIQLSL